MNPASQQALHHTNFSPPFPLAATSPSQSSDTLDCHIIQGNALPFVPYYSQYTDTG